MRVQQSHEASNGVANAAAMTLSEEIADFALGLSLSDVPIEVRERASYLILDALGIGYGSGRHQFAEAGLDAFRMLGSSGRVPVIGLAARLSARDAAVMNGVLVHGLDFDDTHQASIMHSTACILPTILSAGYGSRLLSSELLAAYLAGTEVSIRLGLIAGRAFPVVGFHPTSVLGIFGCAAAAGRLAGLDRESLVMAQGIALSMACGNLECHEEGAWTKRLHPGWAAQAAMTAVALAKAGFTGATKPYEGRFSIYRTHLQEAAPTPELLGQISAGFGREWHTRDVAVKPIPACHWAHACSDAALELRRRHAFGIDDIASIKAIVPAGVIKAVCEPLAQKRRPQNAYAAQFSVPYIIAATLVRERFTLRELEDAALADKKILQLCDIVSYQMDENTTYPQHFTGEVHITLKDGRSLAYREAINRGSKDRPLSNAEIVAKFRENTAGILPDTQAAEIIELVVVLDGDGDAERLIDRLCGAAPVRVQ